MVWRAGEVAEYSEKLFGRELVRFRYAIVGLARRVAREYVETSPLSAALSALMRRGRATEGLDLRARMLKCVVESDLDQARQYLLVNVIETYFRLGRRQRSQFGKILARKEYAKVQDTELTWGDELLLKGEVRGKRETLKRLLTTKFGPLPKDTEARLDAVQSGEELDQYLDRVLVAESLEEVGLDDG